MYELTMISLLQYLFNNYRESIRILFVNRTFCGEIVTACFITLICRIRNLNTRSLHARGTLYAERHRNGLIPKLNINEKKDIYEKL